ncbi:Tyrosine recombinase XerC [Paenibacillus auburnensis]|uniref:Tyrosine recombinase XerC n=1 Tax=Paenibacillus auburnensis TaxID=2905649 RepID=A0ABM9CMU4_9BACL|nr:site-specific integrase [Paenibacillus auburnensis]CAH1218936.1 Tyrosine recombinase XerC [Paenibacillus auburnensis]
MAGSITKVETKFRVTFDFGTDSKGKRIRKYTSASSEAEARKLLNEFEYNQQRNLLVQTTKMTFSEFLEHWIENYVKYNCEETTIYGYRNIIFKHIIPFLGNFELQKLQPAHIQQYYKYLMDDKQLSPNTVHKHHACIRKALDYGLKQQFVHRNVSDAVTLPKKERFVGQSYTRDQLNILLDRVKNTKLELPVYLAGYLGLRREEIVGLQWKYINFKDRSIQIAEVRTSAGSKEIVKAPETEQSKRVLYMTDELFEVLTKARERQEEYKWMLGDEYIDSGYVYIQDNGKPYRVNTLTEQFGLFLERNALPKIRLHDLRHTFASILYEAGVDLKAISEALGYSDLATTNKIYTHRFDKTHKKTINAMSAALGRDKD